MIKKIALIFLLGITLQSLESMTIDELHKTKLKYLSIKEWTLTQEERNHLADILQKCDMEIYRFRVFGNEKSK